MVRRRTSPLLAASAAAPLLAALACAGESDGPAPRACPLPAAEALTRDALDGHMIALAAIADASGGNRASASIGYARSADYVAERLAAAGYAVERQVFEYPHFEVLGGPEVAVEGEPPRPLVLGEDYRVARYSGSAAVVAPIVPIAIQPGPGNQSVSGCAAEDFAALTPGDVALIQRGGCSFSAKADNAAAAGAAAAVIFNQGDAEAQTGLFTVRVDRGTPIPVISAPYDLGIELAEAAAAGQRLRLAIDARTVDRVAENVLAETPPTASGAVLVVGAHLDSVVAGPGINDNGSGVAAVLELAAALGPCALDHQVRFALWGAEELGLFGSYYYVATLEDAALEAIALYLNLDMIASPNAARTVYDGDGSAFDEAGPDGSAAIEAALADYYGAQGLDFGETAFDGRSDYGPFIAAGIPAGGIFTGAEGIKSEDEAARFGGEASVAYDPCYHASCDDRLNYDLDELVINAAAAAQVLEDFAAGVAPLPGSIAGRAGRAPARPREVDDRERERSRTHGHGHGHGHDRGCGHEDLTE